MSVHFTSGQFCGLEVRCGGTKLNEEDVLQRGIRINVECKHFYPLCVVDWSNQSPDKKLSTKVSGEYFSFLSKTPTTCMLTRAYLQIAQAQKRKGRGKNLQMRIFFSYLCKVSANFTQMQ